MRSAERAAAFGSGSHLDISAQQRAILSRISFLRECTTLTLDFLPSNTRAFKWSREHIYAASVLAIVREGGPDDRGQDLLLHGVSNIVDG